MRLPSRDRISLPADERGIALTLAILAIVVIGALVTGTLVLGRLDMTGGRMSHLGRQAHEAAEAGLAEVLANWPREFNMITVGVDSVLPSVSLGGNLRYSPRLYRMNGGAYMLRVVGDRVSPAGAVLATRSAARYVRLFLPELDIQAALTARGNVTIRGHARVDGNDHVPPGGAGCPPLGPAKAGVRTDSTTTVSGPIAVTGSPPQRTNDPGVVDSIFMDPFGQLAPYATLSLAAGAYNGMTPSVTGTPSVCNVSDPNNWGEPYRPPTPGAVSQCQSYFPIVLINGNANVQAGRGQGILLVNGDYDMRGNFEFDGIVLVTGAFATHGTGNKVSGGVLAHFADQFSPTASGDPEMDYSSCAIARALQNSAHAVPFGERSWATLYQ